jgi:hypothetical protein
LFVEKNCTNDKQAADKEIKERIHLLLQRFKKNIRRQNLPQKINRKTLITQKSRKKRLINSHSTTPNPNSSNTSFEIFSTSMHHNNRMRTFGSKYPLTKYLYLI